VCYWQKEMKTDDLHHHFEIKLHSTIHTSFGLIDLFRRLGLNVDQRGEVTERLRKLHDENITFMLPCIVKDFFLNNQPHAPINQSLFCYKNSTCFGHPLCPSSGVLYRTFGTGKFHAGFLMNVSKQSQDGTARKLSSNLYDIHHCRVYSE
jgi:hypothetical protein